MSDWPGSGWGADPDVYHRRPPVGRAGLTALGAAAVMALDAYVLPFVYRGFISEGSGQLATGFSIWTLIHRAEANSLGVGWVYLVGLGLVVAGLGALAEVAFRPLHSWPRWLSVAGFFLVVAGCCLGLIVAAAGSGKESDGLTNPMITGLDKGFWLGLMAGAVGLTASVVHLLEPPNRRHHRPPFGRSPLGRPAPVLPPGFIPPMPEAWVDYIRRGQVPPGYVPPSYGPAVYPSPGFMTPAYVAPGYRSTSAGAGFGTASEYVTPPVPEVIEAQMRALGRLVVSDGPRVSTLLVEPGTRLTVGRDTYAEIRVTDRNVSERHAAIERRGLGWAVQDIDALRATRLVDAWGTHIIVRGEREIPAGQLQVGEVVITLFPVQPERPVGAPSSDEV